MSSHAKSFALFAISATLSTDILGCAKPKGNLFEPVDVPLVWPAPPDPPRLTYLGSIATSRDLNMDRSGTETFLAALRGPRAPIQFNAPNAVAIRHDGMLAVSDTAAASLHIIDLDKRTHLVTRGRNNVSLESPVGVAWSIDKLLVADAARSEIFVFDAAGALERQFGADHLTRPVGLTFIKSRNEICVVDGGAHRLAFFNPNGAFLRAVGHRGPEPGNFNYPTHIHNDNARLYVADSGNFRIQTLTLDGAPLHTFGAKGDAAGDFAMPKGIATDRDGRLYIVDAHFENVQIFQPQGRLLLTVGAEGRNPGEFWLPAGIAIDPQNRLWVADSGNHRLQVFKILDDATILTNAQSIRTTS
jgi:DNA-binding beta-propeller fold protein YncE